MSATGKIMAPARVFAAMTPGACGYAVSSGGCCRSDLPRASEAAALCTGMERRCFTAARWKWGLDREAKRDLAIMLHVEAAGWASDENWTIPRGSRYLETMARFAVEEVHAPQAADGRVRKVRDVTIAGAMRMTPRNYRRFWKRRYARMVMQIEHWAGDAAAHVLGAQRNGG